MDSISPDTPQKQCSTCLHAYPATPEFFSRDRSKQDGLHTTCKVCAHARAKAYRETHKELIRERVKHGRELYKERIATYLKEYQQGEGYKAYQKRYHAEHKEELSAQHREYYEAHAEETRERARRYNKTEQGRLVSKVHKYRRKAQKQGLQGSHTPRQLQEQMQRQKSRCYYCKAKLGKIWHPDHVIPLSRGGSNDISNIVIACPTCNLRKAARLPSEWPEGGRLL